MSTTSADSPNAHVDPTTGVNQSTETPKKRTLLARLRDRMSSSSLKRLKSRIPFVRAELNDLTERNKKLDDIEAENGAPKTPSYAVDWARSAANLLDEADVAVTAHDADQGWLCLKAADRFLLFGIAKVDPELFMTRATAVLNEATDPAKGLAKWRQDSIKALLADNNDKLKAKITAGELVEAKHILDEHQDNVYQRLAMFKSRLALLAVLGAVFLAVWLFILQPPVPQIVTSGGASDLLAPLAKDAAQFWWMVVLAGVLGGLISAFTTSFGADIKKSSIPSELSTQTVTFSRLMVSALSALAVTMFLCSGILSFKQLSYALILAFAVAAGFSDRLLVETINRVGK